MCETSKVLRLVQNPNSLGSKPKIPMLALISKLLNSDIFAIPVGIVPEIDPQDDRFIVSKDVIELNSDGIVPAIPAVDAKQIVTCQKRNRASEIRG